MSILTIHSNEGEFRETIIRLRGQVVRFRALLSGLDHISPAEGREPDFSQSRIIGAQIAEEFGRLGCQFLECAAAATAERASSRRQTGGFAARR
jgi:hypothetical protein